MLRFIVLFNFLILFATETYCEEQVIKGFIKSSKNETIKFATISINEYVTMSDSNGYFEIVDSNNTIDAESILTVRKLGYVSKNIVNPRLSYVNQIQLEMIPTYEGYLKNNSDNNKGVSFFEFELSPYPKSITLPPFLIQTIGDAFISKDSIKIFSKETSIGINTKLETNLSYRILDIYIGLKEADTVQHDFRWKSTGNRYEVNQVVELGHPLKLKDFLVFNSKLNNSLNPELDYLCIEIKYISLNKNDSQQNSDRTKIEILELRNSKIGSYRIKN